MARILALTNQARSVQAKVTNRHLIALEEALKAHPEMEENECPVKHYFTPGMYCREIFMPADTVVVGKMHKTEHINIISAGKAWVVTEDDQKFYVEAPYSFVSHPGCKKALYIIEDMVWTTCHATNETDLDKLEEQMIEPDNNVLLAREVPKQLEDKE